MTTGTDLGAGTRASDRPESTDLLAARGAAFAGAFEPYAERVAFVDGPEALTLADLADRAVFDDLLGRFRRSVAGDDDRAVVSFWSQYYFSAVVIPLAVLLLRAGRDLPLGFSDLKVRFCPQRGTPLCLHVCGRAAPRPGCALLDALLDEHLTPMVAVLRRFSGLSSRLLWENAGCYTAWICGEIVRQDSEAGPAAAAWLRANLGPQAFAAATAHLRHAALNGTPAVRRLCCLRYDLPGVGRCAGSCPLPCGAGPASREGRRRS